MNKLAVVPLRLIGANAESAGVGFVLLNPRGIGSQMHDHVVVLIEQGCAGDQFGNDHHVVVDVGVRRPEKPVERLAMLAVERKPLQSIKLPVRDDDKRFVSTIVDPDAVWQLERAVFAFGELADGTECALPIGIGIVAMDAVSPVAIADEETAVGKKRDIRGDEPLAIPGVVLLRAGKLVFALGIKSAFHRCALPPDLFALGVEFGEGTLLVVSADVQEVLSPFIADFQAMPTAVELFAEGPDELTLGIEDENRGIIREIDFAFVDDIQIAIAIEGDIVRRHPAVFVGKLGEVVQHFVLMLAGADDHVFIRLGGGENGRRGECRRGGCERGFDKLPA